MATVAEIFKTMEYGPAPESDKEALAWLAEHDGKFGHFINGEWVKAKEHFDVMNPATSKVIAKVGQGTAKDVDAAVKAASKALVGSSILHRNCSLCGNSTDQFEVVWFKCGKRIETIGI